MDRDKITKIYHIKSIFERNRFYWNANSEVLQVLSYVMYKSKSVSFFLKNLFSILDQLYLHLFAVTNKLNYKFRLTKIKDILIQILRDY